MIVKKEGWAKDTDLKFVIGEDLSEDQCELWELFSTARRWFPDYSEDALLSNLVDLANNLLAQGHAVLCTRLGEETDSEEAWAAVRNPDAWRFENADERSPSLAFTPVGLEHHKARRAQLMPTV